MHLYILTCPKYRQTGWLTSTRNNESNIQKDRVVYMYTHQRVQYTDRHGGLHVHIPTCPINRKTGLLTCTNVSNIQTDRNVYKYECVQYTDSVVYMYQRVQYTDRQVLGLSGPLGFTSWISLAPVFSFIYC